MIFCITNFCQTNIKWLISTTYYGFMLFWAESSTLNFTYRFEERSVLIGPDICKVRRSIISLNKNCVYFFSQKVKFIRGQQSLLQYTWKHRLPHCHRHITGFLNSVWLILYKKTSKVIWGQQWPHLHSKPYFSFNSFNLFSEFSSTE